MWVQVGTITAFINRLCSKHPGFSFRYNFVHYKKSFLLDKFNAIYKFHYRQTEDNKALQRQNNNIQMFLDMVWLSI